jgi:hypothetical protein
MHPSLSARQLTQANFSAFYANTLCNWHSALAYDRSDPRVRRYHLRNELSRGFIPKKLEVLELTVPPRMFLLSNPVRFISNKQLKLFLKHMKRELKPEEHEEIVSAVAAGDRIKAKNIYLSATEGNLTDAQNYLRMLSAKAEVAESERFVEKSG